MALMQGDLVTAIAEYAADDRIESELSARDPRNNDQRQNMFRVRAILGRTLALVGETEAARRNLRNAIDIANELKKQDPTLTAVQETSALYQVQLPLAGVTETIRAEAHQPVTRTRVRRTGSGQNAAWQRDFAEGQTERGAVGGERKRMIARTPRR
jgi:hypothetical protein